MKYYVINKPYGMLSQFTPEGGHQTLADLPANLPRDVYSVGRLDADSEGLLLLTNDNRLKTNLLNPDTKQPKTYWVQVEGEITPAACRQLELGVVIKHNGVAYQTRPAKARLLPEPAIWERNPPVRFRKSVPTSWVEITLVEGKNRQVRKMTAAVGFPTLRLVRVAMGKLKLGDMPPNTIRELTPQEVTTLKVG